MKLPSVRVQRNSVLFISGLAGIAYETVVGQAERPTLIVLFAAMIGLPAFLRTDEKKQEDATASTPAAEQSPATETPPSASPAPPDPPATPPPPAGGTP